MTPSADPPGTPDPLVPIVPARVEAGLKHRGVSVKALALELEMRQQTLNAIVRSKPPRTCRRSVRSALAESLGCPEDWLAGEIDWEPRHPWRQEPVGGGAKGPAPVGLSGYSGATEDSDNELHEMAEYQLACWDLSRKILLAWSRDRAAGQKKAVEAWQQRKSSPWFSEDGRHVVTAVDRILDVARWDRALTTSGDPDAPPSIRELRSEAMPPSAERRNGFAVRVAKAIEAMLALWFDGQSGMNYQVLSRVLEWIERGMATPGSGGYWLVIMDAVDPDESESSGPA